ncbi:MAG: transposase [Planctomycetales bacterium]|nr:transposase [Planctomycetales bacterium]
MSLADKFGFFDPKQPFTVTFGELPHWEQEGATSFITFRTADSLPAPVIELWQRERDDWLRRHDIDPCQQNWQSVLKRRPHSLQREFHRELATKLEKSLDECHGACVLKRHDLAKIVADSLLYFDATHVAADVAASVAGALRDPAAEPRSVSATNVSATSVSDTPREARYHIADFIVMPNHVHVMVCFLPGTRLRDQCYSWKHFMAVKINKALQRTGDFWQTESFDHLVRDADHFDRFRRYIAKNGEKSGLKPVEFIHYQCPED